MPANTGRYRGRSWKVLGKRFAHVGGEPPT